MTKVKGMKVAKNLKKEKNVGLKKLLKNGQVLVNIFENKEGEIQLDGIYTDPIVENILGKGRAYKLFEYTITDKQTNVKDILEAIRKKGIMMK